MRPRIKLQSNLQNNTCNDRVLYAQYLIGLRKTRKIFKNYTNKEALNSLIYFTNDFITNNSVIISNNTIINNQEHNVRKIIMANVELDVSNVKTINIRTEKASLIIELDKKTDILSHTKIIKNINSIDTIITFMSLVGKALNFY